MWERWSGLCFSFVCQNSAENTLFRSRRHFGALHIHTFYSWLVSAAESQRVEPTPPTSPSTSVTVWRLELATFCLFSTGIYTAGAHSQGTLDTQGSLLLPVVLFTEAPQGLTCIEHVEETGASRGNKGDSLPFLFQLEFRQKCECMASLVGTTLVQNVLQI